MIRVTHLAKKIIFVLFVISSALVYSLAYSKNDSSLSDTTITAAVRTALLKDYDHINLTTRNGTVHLQGMVNSSEDMNAVVERTASVKGVKDVDTTDLFVQGSSNSFTDIVITAKIKGLFIQKEILDPADTHSLIKIEAVNNIVYLSGEAPTISQINQAIAIAKSVKDVKAVDSTQFKLVPLARP